FPRSPRANGPASAGRGSWPHRGQSRVGTTYSIDEIRFASSLEGCQINTHTLGNLRGSLRAPKGRPSHVHRTEVQTQSHAGPDLYHNYLSTPQGIAMADIRAFRGFRYDLGRAGPLSDLVAPPYDVVDPALQRALYDKSPYNAIRLELPADEPGDTPTRNRYTRAAQALSGWVDDHILQRDTLRTLYVVEQEFAVEGTTYRRRGFIARVRLERFGAGRIFPHEETMSGPKEDRLALARATGMNVSPIFGLYPDP